MESYTWIDGWRRRDSDHGEWNDDGCYGFRPGDDDEWDGYACIEWKKCEKGEKVGQQCKETPCSAMTISER